jgi:Regulator of chromosome condensation (RCC1) repeat
MRIGTFVGGICATTIIAFAGCVGDTAVPAGTPDASTDTSTPDTSVPDTSPLPDTGCGDTQSSAANCGSCGHACTGTNACIKGVCGNIPIQLAGSPSAVDNCVVLASGRVYCWGDNSYGEGGTNDKASHNFAALIPTDNTNATFDHVVEVAVGARHTCARKDDGSIWCWGESDFGETGTTVGGTPLLVPQRVGNLIGYTSIRAGGFATCGIDSSGQVFCWGTNDHAVLGHAPNTNSDKSVNGPSCSGTTQDVVSWNNAVPVKIAGVAGATALYMGDQWGCALSTVARPSNAGALTISANWATSRTRPPMPLVRAAKG